MLAVAAAVIALAAAVPIKPTVPGSSPSRDAPTATLHLLFETLQSEVLDQPLLVEGVIPGYVQGTIYRNGFGGYEGTQATGDEWVFKYLFDTLAQLSKFTIRDGEVLFSVRMIQSSYYEESKEKIPAFKTFGGTDPCLDAFGQAQTLIPPFVSDNLNVNVVPHKSGRLIAVSDMSGAMQIDAATLETLGLYEWGEEDPADGMLHIMTSAHPSSLTPGGDIYNYVAQVFGAVIPDRNTTLEGDDDDDVRLLHKYKVFKYNPETQPDPITRETVAEIEIDRAPYMHSFAHTPRYLVFTEWPLMYDIGEILQNVEIYKSLQWEPERGTRIKVIDIAMGEVIREYVTDPLFSYHVVNSFETPEGDIVMDYCVYPDNTHMEAFHLETLRNASFAIPAGWLQRFYVPVASLGEVRTEIMSNTSFDLPMFNLAYKGMPYRYVYGTGNELEGVWWSNLVKIDLETRETKTWFREGHWPSEPVFVADPDGTEEDDGTIISLVLDGNSRASYLLVLDARTFTPIATAHSNTRVPYSSHGFFDPQ